MSEPILKAAHLGITFGGLKACLLYTSPRPRDS